MKKQHIAIYNPYLNTKGGGEKVCLALAESLHNDLGCDITFVSHEAFDIDDLSHYFKIDLSGMSVLKLDFDTPFLKLLRRLPIPGKIRNIFFDYKVLSSVKQQDFDVFINNCYQSNLPAPIKNSVYMCMFPQRLDTSQVGISLIKRAYLRMASALSRAILHPGVANPIDTYKLITANSQYTQGFIRKLWQKDSSILYPICENMHSKGVKKEKVILHVGRFFANVGESHHKRQDILLSTFKRMTKLHKDGWQLHFAGSVAEDVGGLKYILQLIKDAQGFPIFFHFNCSFKELQDLYNKAGIYWHATGYGSDAKKHPEKQEHFGISTVEAMSTGTLPIVINSAGQKESVVHGENGYLWDTLDELARYTTKVSRLSAKQLSEMSESAKASSKQYDNNAFRENVKAIFSSVVS